MKTKTIYLITFLITAGFWQWAYFRFAEHFNPTQDLALELRLVKKELHQKQAQNSLLAFKLRNQAELIAITQSKVDSEFKNEKRAVASVAGNSFSHEKSAYLQVSVAARIEESALLFEHRDYLKVIEKLEPIVQAGEPTEALVRAMFILGESYYQTQQYERCSGVVRLMMEHFPENKQTGFLMLRQGMILKDKQKISEARETFRVIGLVFKDPTLKARAKNLLNQTETL